MLKKKYTDTFLFEIILHELEVLWASGLPEESAYLLHDLFEIQNLHTSYYNYTFKKHMVTIDFT